MSEPIITIRLDDLRPAANEMADNNRPYEKQTWLPDGIDADLRVAMIQSALWYWIRERVDQLVHDTKEELEKLPDFAIAAFERALANAECLGAPLPVPWPAQLVCGPAQIDVWRGSRNQRTAHIRRLTLIEPTGNTPERWAEARNAAELADEALAAFDAWRLANDPDAVLIRVACGWCPCPPELAAKAVW